MTVKQKTVNLELMPYTPKWARRLSARRALVVAMYTMLWRCTRSQPLLYCSESR